MTLDNTENSLNVSDYLAPIMASIVLPKLGATNISVRKTPHNQITHWDRWSAHERGGARMGSNPQTSVFNKWMQSWDVPNLFSVGEHNIMLGDTVTAGTHGIGPLSYVAVDGIKKYLESPGPLV